MPMLHNVYSRSLRLSDCQHLHASQEAIVKRFQVKDRYSPFPINTFYGQASNEFIDVVSGLSNLPIMMFDARGSSCYTFGLRIGEASLERLHDNAFRVVQVNLLLLHIH